MLSGAEVRIKLMEAFGESYYQSKNPSEYTQQEGYDIIVVVKKEPTDAKD